MHNLITRGSNFKTSNSNNQDSSNDDSGDSTNNNPSGNLGNQDKPNGNDPNSNGNTPSQNGTWIDLCKTPLEQLELEYTDGVEIKQDLERGIWARGAGSFLGRGVKFTRYQWKRDGELPFSFVFTARGSHSSFLFGIGSPDIDVNNLGSQALFAGEIQLFYDNGRFNRFLGGSGIRNWAQDVQANLKFEEGIFYKVVFEKSGKVGSQVYIYRVTKDDFDTNLETFGNYTIVKNPADSDLLIPYWNAVSTPDVFITAIYF